MLTLQELKQIIDFPEDREKLPTVRQLRTSGLMIAREQFGGDAEISAYQNGCALYQAGGGSTVFYIHLCKGYSYLSDGVAIHLQEQFFDNERWYLRLVLEGEDRLKRNHEEKNRNWNISYSAISEEWVAMGNMPEPIVENLIKQETFAEILQVLTERQKFIVQRYYLQEETQKQISKELGISQQAVSVMLSKAIRSIREKCLFYDSSSSHGGCCGEGLR